MDSPDSLRIVLTHELIHVRRTDYAWALIECFTAAAFAFHPLVRLLRRAIDRCRETSCDAEVVESGIAHLRTYAELLVRIHTPKHPPMPVAAASMLTRASTLKQRLETMEKSARTRPTPRLRAGTLLASGLLFLVIAATGACAGGTGNAASSQAETTANVHFTSQAGFQSDDAMDAALERLDVQLAYLRERMEENRRERADLPESAQMRGAQYDIEDWRSGQRMDQAYGLLNSMYQERLKASETLKLERETKRRLEERS